MVPKFSLAGALIAALALAVPATVSAYGRSSANHSNAMTSQSIASIAAANPEFSTLVSALKAADLVATLDGAGPFTVFAPTDAAFARLPAGTVEALLKPENKAKLRAILTYRVVPGRVMASDVVKLSDATTVEGSKLAIRVVDGKVLLNDTATVTTTDIKASNGVIHVIDTVVLPPPAN